MSKQQGQVPDLIIASPNENSSSQVKYLPPIIGDETCPECGAPVINNETAFEVFCDCCLGELREADLFELDQEQTK